MQVQRTLECRICQQGKSWVREVHHEFEDHRNPLSFVWKMMKSEEENTNSRKKRKKINDISFFHSILLRLIFRLPFSTHIQSLPMQLSISVVRISIERWCNRKIFRFFIDKKGKTINEKCFLNFTTIQYIDRKLRQCINDLHYERSLYG